MSKVSVIISVYNAKDFLKRSLDSLVSQTHTDLQIICIDDCSTDGSLDILRDYEARDSRFCIITLKQNIGFAKARNIGLQHVKGDYVCTLDADDWFSPDAIEGAVEVFKKYPKTDCVMFQMYYVDGSTGEETRFEMDDFDVLPGREAALRSLSWNGIHGWYLTHTSLHQKIPFDDTTRVYSDENTCRCHFLLSREVRQSTGIYYYWQHPQSVTHKVSMSYFDHLRASNHLLEDLTRYGADEEIQQQVVDNTWHWVIGCYYYAYQHRQDLSKEQLAQAMAEIRRLWERIDVKRIRRDKYKFGYMPLRFSWRLFCLQEEVYFFLRKILRRN